MTDTAENDELTCGEHYGRNPDPCHRESGHEGAHSNRWGTTWASAKQWRTRAAPPRSERPMTSHIGQHPAEIDTTQPTADYPGTLSGRVLFSLHWCAWKAGKALYRPRIIPPRSGAAVIRRLKAWLRPPIDLGPHYRAEGWKL